MGLGFGSGGTDQSPFRKRGRQSLRTAVIPTADEAPDPVYFLAFSCLPLGVLQPEMLTLVDVPADARASPVVSK